MVYLKTLEEWQKQSSLLLQARPSTARVTTKYNIPNLSSAKYQKSRTKEQEKTDKDESQPRAPRATITLKTYDPDSGVTLKFKTDRAADVGRTIAGLGTLGRHMAALPPKAEAKEVLEDVTSETAKTIQDTNASAEPKPAAPSANTGGGRKKKKGKK